MKVFRQNLLWPLGALLLLGVALWFIGKSFNRASDEENTPSSRKVKEVTARRAQLEAREQAADRTFWAKEMLAQTCGRTFEMLWDKLNVSSNKLEVLAEFPLGEILVPDWRAAQELPHGIEVRAGATGGTVLSATQWRQRVEQFKSDGWQIENVEFRHNRFDTDPEGQPWRSHFYFAANLTHSTGSRRASLDGDLVVDWGPRRPGEELYPVKRIDASGLELKTRTGEPPFKLILQETITPRERAFDIDPLLVYDLDGDGLPEIILASKNLVYRRHGPDHYQPEPLCQFPLDFINTAVIADFDGDGAADFLCATSRGLFLFKGSADGHFDEPPRLVWRANPPLKDAMALTCADIDHDGALDVFLAQYKVPTLGQVLRPYYYDANDGWPAYLLHNDGQGNFTDITVAAGLGAKRWRRTYSASLADLDADGHPDLLVVSDFAGLDLYQNDGQGHFNDVTRKWVAEPHAFGMADALADFNADGRLDLLMIGMPSPTVDRLQHLDLWRPYSAEDRLRRPAMTYGNRLFLARTNGAGFEQTGLNDSIARSGWSWGCSALDFDNDGFPDLYIANGLQSQQSVRDYESEFWLHNIFIDETIDDVTATGYLVKQFDRTRGQGWSYGGYEKNRLFLNRQGQSFVEIGHLAGVALEQDCRNVVGDDLDGDGRVDLVVTTRETWPEPKQTLRVYRNALEDSGHWIGFRFREQRGKSPVGVRVTIHYQGRSATRQIVTGDSHRSQHSTSIHFGLGSAKQVERVEIMWPNGSDVKLEHPGADQYHLVNAPERK